MHVYFQASSRPVPRCGLRSSWHATWCTAGSTPRARLGIDPHAGFAAAAGHLGPWTENSAITFGKHGAPFYIAGPYDHARAVIGPLTETVGEDNFTFVPPVQPAGLSAQ